MTAELYWLQEYGYPTNFTLECDHCFVWMATLPPSHCPKCGKYLGKQPETRITC